MILNWYSCASCPVEPQNWISLIIRALPVIVLPWSCCSAPRERIQRVPVKCCSLDRYAWREKKKKTSLVFIIPIHQHMKSGMRGLSLIHRRRSCPLSQRSHSVVSILERWKQTLVTTVSPLATFPNSAWIACHKDKPYYELLEQAEVNFLLIPDESILNDEKKNPCFCDTIPVGNFFSSTALVSFGQLDTV